MNNPKVGVFTLTHALNYGAFFQMYAMATYLNNLGYDVTIFDCQKTFKYRLLRHLSYHPVRQFRKLSLGRQFNQDRKKLKIESYKGQYLDLAILGSDEIWNIDNSSFENAPEYLGINVNAARKIAYAPSIGYADPSRLIQNPKFKVGLNLIDEILARDERTRLVAEEVVGRTIENVVDPTMLLDNWKEYISGSFPLNEDYILYYGYSGSPLYKDALLEFSRQRNIRIYTAGFRTHQWCDKNFIIGPRHFLSLMNGARYVFTDTFHGYVMSVLLDKMVCFSAPMQKTKDIARRLGMLEDVLDEASGTAEIVRALYQDRDERNKKLALLRKESQAALARALCSHGNDVIGLMKNE